MKILEYEAKRLLSKAGICTPQSTLIRSRDDMVTLPIVLKSQVPTGGRGKAGGVVVVDDPAEYAKTVDQLFGLSIKGYMPKTILAEERIAVAKEYYLAVLVDRTAARIQLVANRQGGVEVESNDSASFLRLSLTSDAVESVTERLAAYLHIESAHAELRDVVQGMLDCLVHNDALLVEVNPFIQTRGGRLVAGDAKIELDDAAAFRHADWQFEASPARSNFVTLDSGGSVATIANGAGLAMATVDAVADYGMHPANFLDIGGGANSASILTAFRQIMEYQQVAAIIINIFAGITRCDEVAKAIVVAREQIDSLPPLCIRLSGTNLEEAVSILADHNITLLPSLEACLEAAYKEVCRA